MKTVGFGINTRVFVLVCVLLRRNRHVSMLDPPFAALMVFSGVKVQPGHDQQHKKLSKAGRKDRKPGYAFEVKNSALP